MITRLHGAECIDGIGESRIRDLYFDGETICSTLPKDSRIDFEYRLDNHILVAGGIDLHTHIGGGKVNIARLLLPELVEVSFRFDFQIRFPLLAATVSSIGRIILEAYNFEPKSTGGRA